MPGALARAIADGNRHLFYPYAPCFSMFAWRARPRSARAETAPVAAPARVRDAQCGGPFQFSRKNRPPANTEREKGGALYSSPGPSYVAFPKRVAMWRSVIVGLNAVQFVQFSGDFSPVLPTPRTVLYITLQRVASCAPPRGAGCPTCPRPIRP